MSRGPEDEVLSKGCKSAEGVGAVLVVQYLGVGTGRVEGPAVEEEHLPSQLEQECEGSRAEKKLEQNSWPIFVSY